MFYNFARQRESEELMETQPKTGQPQHQNPKTQRPAEEQQPQKREDVSKGAQQGRTDRNQNPRHNLKQDQGQQVKPDENKEERET
jgi:hypothetical protein